MSRPHDEYDDALAGLMAAAPQACQWVPFAALPVAALSASKLVLAKGDVMIPTATDRLAAVAAGFGLLDTVFMLGVALALFWVQQAVFRAHVRAEDEHVRAMWEIVAIGTAIIVSVPTLIFSARFCVLT